MGEILKAKTYFTMLINEFPKTDYAEDAKFKLELIEEVLASKELYLANYYLDREKWIPAMNRYKKIVNQYDTTIYVEEALYRLVELNYKIGLIDEAEKYASLLGYNYQSSQWYEASYKLINKDYKPTFGALETFEITRGIWPQSQRTISKDAKYAYATFGGVVKEIYEIHSWVPAGTQQYFTIKHSNERLKNCTCEFIGKIASDEIRDLYLEKILVRERSYGNTFIPVGN